MQTVQMSPETASKIQQLARINVDSSDGFRKAAKVVQSPALTELFQGYANERAMFAAELQESLGPEQAREFGPGTLKAQAHRWWMELRSLLSRGDFAILDEAERAEDQITAAYEEVNLETVGTPMNDLLGAQLRHVKAGHDRIRALRDAAKA